MNKKVLVEIERINELMGLSLISEVVTPNLQYGRLVSTLRNAGDEVFDWVKKGVPEIETIIKSKGRKIANLTDDEIGIIMRNLSDDGIRKIATSAFNNGQIFSQTTIDRLVDTFVTKIIDNPNDYIQLMKKLMRDKDNFYGNYPQGNMPETIQKIANQVYILFRTRIDDVIKSNHPTTWNKVQEVVKKNRGLGKNYADVDELSGEMIEKIRKNYGSNWFRNQKVFLMNVLNFLKNEQKIIDELLSTIKSYESNPSVDLMKRISDLFFEATTKRKENFKDIEEWLSINDKAGLLQPLRIKGYDGYQKALAISNGQTFKDLQYGMTEFWKRKGELRNKLLEVLWPGAWGSKSLKSKYGENNPIVNVFHKWRDIFTGTEFKRLRYELLTGQTKTWAEFQKTYKSLGVPKAIFDLGMEYVISWVILGLLASFLDFLSDIVGNALSIIPYIKEWKLVKMQATQYDKRFGEKISGEKYDNDFQIFLDGISSLLGDIVYYLRNNLFSLERLIPTIIDDFAIFYQKYTRFKDSLGDRNSTTQEVETATQELRQEADSLRTAINNAQDSLTSNQSPRPSSDSTDIKRKFESFLREKGLTGQFNPTDSTGTDSTGTDYYYDTNLNTFQKIE